MADTVKFNDEELGKIKELQNAFNALLYLAGQTYMEGLVAEKKKTTLLERFDTLKQDEQELVSNLTSTYGQGKINLETGEFTPVPTTEEETES
jgi:DNA repair ATPase RecN